MRKKMIFKFGVTVVILIAIYLYFVTQNIENKSKEYIETEEEVEDNINAIQKKEDEHDEDSNTRPLKSNHWKDGIHVAVVACGDRGEETVILLKSAVLLTAKPLVFHIFAEHDLHPMFKQQLEMWPKEYRDKLLYYIYNITFPEDNTNEWKKLFKPCASQRLFIPSLLKDVDSLLYVDTDILFLRPLEEIWDFFSKFNSTHLAALAPEHEDASAGWYNRFARHPFYPPLGVNSGVMLMNLTRLRNSIWLQSLMDYYKEYKLKITWGDQDLINIYFHYHPDQLFIYKCEWNYRPDHCMYMSVCKDIEHNGVSVLHGCRRVMQNDKQPAFKAVYKAFKEHQFTWSLESGLLTMIKDNLKNTASTPCGKLRTIYTTHIEDFIQNHKANS